MTEQLLAPPRAARHQPADLVTTDRSGLGVAPAALLDGDVAALLAASFALQPAESDYERGRRRRSVTHVTRWLARFPGGTWQARWVAAERQHGGAAWPDQTSHDLRGLLFKGARTLICLGVVLPDYPWLLDSSFGSLFIEYRRATDPAGYDAITQALRDLRTADRVVQAALVAAARICIHTGAATPTSITADDLITLDTVLRESGRTARAGHEALWQALHRTGQISGPTSLRAAHRDGQLSVEQLVDRYELRCEPVRNLIVDYVTDRAAAMDYNSTSNLAFWLGKLFWADLERHHAGIDSLRIAPEVAAAWKQRVAVRITRRGVEVPRENRHVVLATVHAFYVDLNQWAHEDPARWAQWAAPCPVRKSELKARNKHRARVVAKMHARTRTLAEFVPALVATARARRTHADALLRAARDQPLGATLVVDGTSYEVIKHRYGRRRLQTAAGALVDPIVEEAEAFWTAAAIEVMRLSGLRIEEVMELTHLSIRRYTQPDGQIVPLLQVAPSKMDSERVFPISPELAHVFAEIISRVRAGHATVPLCPRYDDHERTFGPPLPHLFQRPYGAGHQVFSPSTVRNWLDRTLARTDLRDVDGQPIRFLPHDFRRLFATDAVNTGLPIHIAAAVLGHRAVDTTRSYTAIYPEEVIRHYQAFILNRRATRPSSEYREPTGEEWAEFEKHFTLRQVAYGSCDRPYASPCAHEHACIRCPMLRPQPSRLPLLQELETNLNERITEARERVWLGEVEGLQQTLLALRGKTEQAQRLVAVGVTDDPVTLT